jgi:hypothetical protein
VVDKKDESNETAHLVGSINPTKVNPSSDINTLSDEEKKIIQIDSFTDRPKFRPSTKEAIPIVRGQEDRRHITAWQAMHERLKISVNGKNAKHAFDVLSRLDPKYTPQNMSTDAIKAAGKSYLLDKFNDDSNLWAGPAKENQEKGRQFAQAKLKVDKALEAGNKADFDANIQILEALWEDPDQNPDPESAKAGFKNMVGMTIRLIKKAYREKWG